MTPDELRHILSQPEGLKIDFKQEYKLSNTAPAGSVEGWKQFVDGQWHEFIKDIIALTNGNYGTAEQFGILVVGAGDDLRADGTRELFDMRDLDLREARIIPKVNSACSPPIANIHSELVVIDGNALWVICIPPSPYLHETTRDLVITKGDFDGSGALRHWGVKQTYTARTAFVRWGEAIRAADRDTRVRLQIEKSPETAVLSTGLVKEDLQVPDTELDRVRKVFEEPVDFDRARNLLGDRCMLWITGPAGMWKQYMALSLALAVPDRIVYSIPRSVRWSQVEETRVQDAVLVLPDTLGPLRFERENLDDECRFLVRLLAKGNVVIATSHDEIFADAVRETHILDWMAKHSRRFEVNAASYNYDKKKSILSKLVDYYCEMGTISVRQKDWVLDLIDVPRTNGTKGQRKTQDSREFLARLLKKTWLPMDIERFVKIWLPEARSPRDLLGMLRRDTDLNSRVKGWFVDLENSTKCFILTLTLFPGAEAEVLWSRHKQIVASLRDLDPSLSILPLGVLRQQADPYISAQGPIDFVDMRVYNAVVNEVARNYREYLLELIPALKAWTIPEVQRLEKEERDELLRQSDNSRNAIARVVGEVGRYGVADIRGLLEDWASSHSHWIGKTPGIALRQTVQDPSSAQDALSLLHEWSRDFISNEARYFRWAAASAFGRIASLTSSLDLVEYALQHVRRLAKDHDDYVRGSASFALKMMARTVSLERMAPILTRLANDENLYIRRQVALAVNDAAGKDVQATNGLLKTWMRSEEVKVRWTAVYALLAGRRLAGSKRHVTLALLTKNDPLLFAHALTAALTEDEAKTAWLVFEKLVSAKAGSFRETFVSAMAGLATTHGSSLARLSGLIGAASSEAVRGLDQEIDAEIQAREEAARQAEEEARAQALRKAEAAREARLEQQAEAARMRRRARLGPVSPIALIAVIATIVGIVLLVLAYLLSQP